jgi:hypothetical protein
MTDKDCEYRYPWAPVCEYNMCVPKSTWVPTSTMTSYPHTTYTWATTVTVYPPPPPYHPTTVTVYACTTTATKTYTTYEAEATLFPNLIVPIKEEYPDARYGTQYTGYVYHSSTTGYYDVDSLIAFDVPYFYETQDPTCKLTFTMPTVGTGFPRTVSGTGEFDIYELIEDKSIEYASWNDRPTRGQWIGRIKVVDGTVAEWVEGSDEVSCYAGSRVGIEMVPVGVTELEWFEMKTPLTGLTLEIYA